MNKKIASEIAVGIVLFLAIVIGGVFWLQSKKVQAPIPQQVINQSAVKTQAPTEQSKDNSRVYTNDKFGFSVQIPHDWGNTENVTDEENDVFFSSPQTSEAITEFNAKQYNAKADGKTPSKEQEPTEDITVQVYKNTEKTLAAFMDTQMMAPEQKDWQKIDLAGKNAFAGLASGSVADPTPIFVIYSENNGSIYEIIFGNNINSLQDVQSKYQFFIDTFKFTDTQANDETANWQTYSNSKLGFEMKYPASWKIEEHFGIGDEFGIGSKTKDSYLVFKKTNGFAM